MDEKRRLPKKFIKKQKVIVERTAQEIEQVLDKYQGLDEQARMEIRKVMDENLGRLEYFVLVTENSFGEIHTNHLREGIYFDDPVGIKCALVSETTSFFYPRNTGEQLIDVSTPVYLNGKRNYALRSGKILHGTNRHIKIGIPFLILQLLGLSSFLLGNAYLAAAAIMSSSGIIIWDRFVFHRAYWKWISFLRMIGKGNLENKLFTKSRDEFGQIQFELNKMGLGVANVIHQVEKSSEQVSASAEELRTNTEETRKATEHIALAIQEVSIGSEQQATDINVSAITTNQMATEIQRIKGHAQSVSSQTVVTSEAASKGNALIQTAIQQMTSINHAVENLSKVVLVLGERSDEIAEIVNVMADIHTQTNLLALNASIEAARAGEEGKGFAIVAEEIRKLSEQSAVSTQSIDDLIQTIQKETYAIEQASQASAQEVSTGIHDIHLAGDSFEEIQRSVNKVVTQNKEISQAIQQLSVSSGEVATSIDSISEVVKKTNAEAQQVSAFTEEQVATMDEITSSTANLSKMSNELQRLIARFHV